MIDSDGIILLANEALHELLGHESGSLTGTAVRQIFPQWEWGTLIEDLLNSNQNEIGETPKRVEREISALKKDRNSLLLRVSVIRKREFGKSLEVLTILPASRPHLTKRSELIDSQFREAVIAGMPDLVFRTDHLGNFLAYYAPANNPPTISAEDFVGRNVRDVFPINVSQSFITGIQKAISSGQLVTFEYVLEIEGNPNYFEGRILSLEEGKALSIIRDITERHLAQEAVAKSEERFRAMVEHSQDIFIVTHQDRLHYVSENVERILGYSPSEFRSLPPEAFVHPDFLPLRWDEMKEPGQQLVIEYLARHKNGEWRWIEGLGVNLMHIKGVEGMVFNLRDISERKAREAEILEFHKELENLVAERTKALQASERFLRETQRTALLGSWEMDTATGEVSWSEEMYRIFGLDPAGSPPTFEQHRHHFEAKEWDLLNELVNRAATIGESYERDFKIFREDGHIGYAVTRGRPHYDEHGHITKLFGVAYDITARKASEEVLEKFFSLSLDLLCITDLKGQFVKLNKAWEDILGYPTEVLEQKYFQEFVHPEDLAATAEAMRLLNLGQLVSDFQNRYLSKDGTYRNMDWRAKPDGKYIYAVARDVTDERQSKEHLFTLSERLQLATQAAHIGIWDWDIDKDHLTWDDTMHVLFGVDPKAFQETYDAFLGVLYPEDRLSVMEDTRNALLEGENYYTEFRVLWPDKSLHYIKGVGKVKRDAQGRAIRMIGTNWDITRQKDSAEAIQLYLSKIKAKNKELEQFAYIASHDLQEPLRTVSNYSQLLVKEFDSLSQAEIQQFLLAIQDSTQRMGRLIIHLLNYSRLGAEISMNSLHMGTVVQHAVNDLGATLIDSQTMLHIGPMPALIGSEALLHQLMLNLIGNAVKFRKKDVDPIIEIKAEWMEEMWRFSVKDNGIGISQQYHERIFMIFQRLHLEKDYAGNGIGLANCKKIVEIHGGNIWVESTPGMGSTFYFTLHHSPRA